MSFESSRLPPLGGATALRQAVLASAASQTTYDRRTQDLLDKVTDVLSFGPSGLRSKDKNGKDGSSSAGGGGSNVPTQTTTSVLDGRRKQVTALKMDPPSTFDDLRDPPKAVKQQILAQIARKNRNNKKKSAANAAAASGVGGGAASGIGAQFFARQQQQQNSGNNENDEDDEDDYDEFFDEDAFEKKSTKDAKNKNNNNKQKEGGEGEEDDDDPTAQSAVFLDSKKAAAAAAKPIPYYLRKGNRSSHQQNNSSNNKDGSGGDSSSSASLRKREIVIALGSDRMDAKELQRIIEHEYGVRMCEQLGISPSASNIARIHKKLPLSDCSITQVMHPGLARGERRNCISIVPKYVKEQEERKLADLRGERNSLWNRANLTKKKEDLDETELMALLKTEEVSRDKRQATATINAHLQHMPGGSATTAGLSKSNNSNNDSSSTTNDTDKKNGENNNNHHQDQNNNNKKDGSSSSPLSHKKDGNGFGGHTTNTFEDIKNRFVFPFNEPVRNAKRNESVFESTRATSTSPNSGRKISPKSRSSNVVTPSTTRRTPAALGQQRKVSSSSTTRPTQHTDEEQDQPEQEEEYLAGGQDRTEARLAMQDKLIQQKLIQKQKEKRQAQLQAEEAERKRRESTIYGASGFSKQASQTRLVGSEQQQQPTTTTTAKSVSSVGGGIDPDLQRLLSETDVVRLSEAQLERLNEQKQKQNNNNTKQRNLNNNDDEDVFYDEEERINNQRRMMKAMNNGNDNNNYNRPSSVDAVDGESGMVDRHSSQQKKATAFFDDETPPKNQQQKQHEEIEQLPTIDVSAMYKQYAVPLTVITECTGIPPNPARVDLDEIRRQFLRNVPFADVFGQDMGPLLKNAILSEHLLKAQEVTIEFFSEVCFVGPVKRQELLRENGRWLSKHVSSTTIDLQFAKMYEFCTKLLRDRANTASVSKVVTRSAILFLVLRYTIRSYFVRRSPGLVTFEAGNQMLSDMDCIFCASVDPGCLYARVPQLESMPQALRVLHAKRANRSGKRHILNPKAVSAKLQFVLGDSKVLRRFQSIGTKSYEPHVLQDSSSAAEQQHQQSRKKHHQDDEGGDIYDDDEDEDMEIGENQDLLSHFLQQKSARGANNNNKNQNNLDFGDKEFSLEGFDGTSSSPRNRDSRVPLEQTQPHITRGLVYLKRILSPNVKTLLLDLRI